MKNYNLINIKESWKELKALSGDKGYYIPMVKNIKLIDIELEGIDLIKTPTEEFNRFMLEKDEVLKKFATKDGDGNPIKLIENIDGVDYYKYDISDEAREGSKAELTKIVEKYKDCLDDMKLRETNYITTMNSDCSITFHKINEASLPKEMTPELFEIIEDFVEYGN